MEKCGLVILDASDFTKIMMKKNPSYEIEFSSDGVTVIGTENDDPYIEDVEKVTEILSKVLGEKVLGYVCVNSEDDYEVWVKCEPGKISINTKAGKICAEAAGDPDYPGIYTYFVPDGDTREVDLCSAELPVDTNEIGIYIWSDPFSEEWQSKESLPVAIIKKALEED